MTTTKIIKQYKHTADLEEVKIITDILHYTGTDPDEKLKIENEQEAWRTYGAMFEDERNELLNELSEKNKALDEKDKALDGMDKALDEKDKALGEKNKALDEKNKALEEMARKLEELQRKLGEK